MFNLAPRICATDHRTNRDQHPIEEEMVNTGLSTRVFERTKVLLKRMNRCIKHEGTLLETRNIPGFYALFARRPNPDA